MARKGQAQSLRQRALPMMSQQQNPQQSQSMKGASQSPPMQSQQQAMAEQLRGNTPSVTSVVPPSMKGGAQQIPGQPMQVNRAQQYSQMADQQMQAQQAFNQQRASRPQGTGMKGAKI